MSSYLDSCDLYFFKGIDCSYHCLKMLFSVWDIVESYVALVLHSSYIDRYARGNGDHRSSGGIRRSGIRLAS